MLSRGIWPARSRARVSFYPGERRDVQRTALRLFGRKLSAWEYAGLTGAPDDAQVRVGTYDGGLYLEMVARAPNCCLGIWLVRPARSAVVIVNDAFQIQDANMRGKGLGLRIFCRQLGYAKALGVERIKTTAGRQGNENGYYTWPRFGFEGPLPWEIKRGLPRGLAYAKSVLDLMEHERGRLWWKQHGCTIDVGFDMSYGSRCWRVFREYLRHKRGMEPQPDVDPALSFGKSAGGWSEQEFQRRGLDGYGFSYSAR